MRELSGEVGMVRSEAYCVRCGQYVLGTHDYCVAWAERHEREHHAEERTCVVRFEEREPD